ncbi:hypothetical protein L1D14_04225 [Vibrio tubiashii]|uniref:hypothetical protein n=1 Tax=Vibrio tubiashii TaxID=29498 RepID=UPI001EFE6651|nr:hypothetical protein [Vibrio tubiashii]MCG9575438.1 hypothetical protein [Vibrio tubiashii]
MSNVMTVVIRYQEDASFAKKLICAYKQNELVEGAEIVAISNDDEISRVEQFENREVIKALPICTYKPVHKKNILRGFFWSIIVASLIASYFLVTELSKPYGSF